MLFRLPKMISLNWTENAESYLRKFRILRWCWLMLLFFVFFFSSLKLLKCLKKNSCKHIFWDLIHLFYDYYEMIQNSYQSTFTIAGQPFLCQHLLLVFNTPTQLRILSQQRIVKVHGLDRTLARTLCWLQYLIPLSDQLNEIFLWLLKYCSMFYQHLI